MEPNKFKSAWEYFCSLHTPESLKISLQNQHITENFLDLSGFFSSIENDLEEERLDEPIKSFPLGYFQVEQPSRIRYMKIVFYFTIIERRIRALIKLSMEVHPEIKSTLSDYKGSFLERVKLFVKENLEIDISQSTSWEQLINFQMVRDCIIHCGGNIFESRDKDKLLTLIEKENLEVNGNGYLRLNDEFCIKLASSGIDFVKNGLNNLLNKLIDKNKNNA